MIGKIEWKIGNTDLVAVLRDDGKWQCADKVYERILNGGFDPANYNYPADGIYGFAAITSAARYFGAKAEYKEVKPPHEGEVVY